MPQLSESPASARAGARELVKNIAKDHGCPGEDFFNQMFDNIRREVEEAMLRNDKIIGPSVGQGSL
ncbi:hypothetical protein Egran_03834 [Elaphomyces granulatus]|uniref:Uncharacterized protein n=1 Tax=Elaphomyces granulatus TaxID=519963 RepID=A0A232LW48_9EURO|nr:hypothetical protein Egran_03834 [Elaphomyces granulatus]